MMIIKQANTGLLVCRNLGLSVSPYDVFQQWGMEGDFALFNQGVYMHARCPFTLPGQNPEHILLQ